LIEFSLSLFQLNGIVVVQFSEGVLDALRGWMDVSLRDQDTGMAGDEY
jgi:hypothetical protein